MGADIAASPHCPRSSPCPKARLLPGAGSGRGLSAPVGSLSGSSSKSRSFVQGSQGLLPKQAPFRVPVEASHAGFPRDGRLDRSPSFRPLPVPVEANFSGFRSGRRRSEASPAPFRGSFARRLRFRWTLLLESGVGIRLSPSPRASSSRAPDLPALSRLSRRSAALPPSGRCRELLFSVSGGNSLPPAN
jgi:hypothetical protein